MKTFFRKIGLFLGVFVASFQLFKFLAPFVYSLWWWNSSFVISLLWTLVVVLISLLWITRSCFTDVLFRKKSSIFITTIFISLIVYTFGEFYQVLNFFMDPFFFDYVDPRSGVLDAFIDAFRRVVSGFKIEILVVLIFLISVLSWTILKLYSEERWFVSKKHRSLFMSVLFVLIFAVSMLLLMLYIFLLS